MSVIVRNIPEDAQTIMKDLYVVAKQFRKKNYGAKVKDITAFHYDESKDVLHLPFYYGKQRESAYQFRYRKIQGIFHETLYENQVVVVEEALEHLKEHGCTTLEITTGFGKTRMMSYLICEINLLSAFVVPYDALCTQTRDTILECTNLIPWIYGDEKEPEHYDVIIILIHKVPKLSQTVKNRIGLVCVDEIHEYYTDKRVKSLLSFNPKYLITASATIKKTNGIHKVLDFFDGGHRIVRRPKGGNVVILKTNLKFEHYKKITGDLDWTRLETDIHDSEERNDMILKLIKFLAKKHDKMMIATIREKHALILHTTLLEEGYNSDFLVGNKKEFEDSQVFIGGYKKVGVGFDQAKKAKNFDGKQFELLIKCSSILEPSSMEQLFGRLRNKKGIFYHIQDSDKVTERHLRENKKFFKEIGANIEEYDLLDYISENN